MIVESLFSFICDYSLCGTGWAELMNFNSGGAVEAGFLPQLEGPTQTGGGS